MAHDVVISTGKLDQIAEALAEFRGKGHGQDGANILFDSRDRGNYMDYDWASKAAMFRKADPTGLAEGMMLHEMIEATIRGSTVRLSQVLREDGFIDRLKVILAIKDDLMADIGGSFDSLIAGVSKVIYGLAPDDDAYDSPAVELSSREVTICLRDAIYCIDQGLTLRWIQCDGAPLSGSPVIHSNIEHFQDISSFIDALRHRMPFGAHLARIGRDHTAIGMKQPGRIAYLSSMTINRHDGKMMQDMAHGSLGAESFDLNYPIQRYPQWVDLPNLIHERDLNPERIKANQELAKTHPINHIKLLPTDRLIWLSMVVEMASIQMERETSAPALVESVALALPSPGEGKTGLPVLFKPNWTMNRLSPQSLFDEIGATGWVRGLFDQALSKLSDDVFLPTGDKLVFINIDSGEAVELTEEAFSALDYFENARLTERHIRMHGLSLSVVGTREEVEETALFIYKRNLKNWLIVWSDFFLKKSWPVYEKWFEQKVRDNLEQAIVSPQAQWSTYGHNDWYTTGGIVLRGQKKKRKTPVPMCVFNDEMEPTHSVRLKARTHEDMVSLLGASYRKGMPSVIKDWDVPALVKALMDLGWDGRSGHLIKTEVTFTSSISARVIVNKDSLRIKPEFMTKRLSHSGEGMS